MKISLKYSQWITLLSFMCLCLRLCVCQAPPMPVQNSNQRGVCGNCRPGWINQLDNFAFMIRMSGRMRQICNFALQNNVVNVCNNNNCNHMQGANYCCCPLSDLSLVGECFNKTTTRAVCIPDTMTPWQAGFQQAFFSA